ncbi:unnamed protein product [Mytilus edulis]|uniref:B box-type domain-containing protein n=1 Tax=Mytilus edulis TaxID=6550 RepID=A0A8S3RVP4_MYTED|nr:unnamed protein product [Mytilus edulis]
MADKLFNTCKLEAAFDCRFHTKETYQLYCKDCHDFVCFECLGELHDKHKLCRLQDAEEDIRNQIGISFTKNENCIKSIQEFSDIIDKNMRQLTIDEGLIEHQIRTNAEQMKEQISLHEKYLLSELHTMFQNFKISSKDLTTRVENLQSDVTKFDVDKLPEINLEEMINVLSELKACTLACDKMKKYQRPNFNTDIKCGNEMFDVDVYESMNISSMVRVSVSTQTDDPDDSDTEDEWFDAENDMDEDSIEKSSDDMKNDNLLHVYKLNKEIGHIKKICPISRTDAWILADQQLYKMVNKSLEDTIHVDDVDDVVVLKGECVLILRNNSRIIMELLQNRRLVRFANVGTDDMLPFCFCNSIDDTLTIYLISKSRGKYGYRNCFLQLNQEGIVKVKMDRTVLNFEKPYLMLDVQSNVCLLYEKYSKKFHYIHLLKATNNTCEMIKSFKGIFGDDPSEHFECQGMCTDNTSVFVTDIRHQSVFVLNKDLEYRKCVVNARHGLDKPTAIAIFNDHLWIADGDQVFIAELNNING